MFTEERVPVVEMVGLATAAVAVIFKSSMAKHALLVPAFVHLKNISVFAATVTDNVAVFAVR